MPDDGRDGLRLHQLIVGGVSALAYLVGRPPLLCVALGLSVSALVSPRFAVVARLCALVRRRQADAAASLRYGPYRFDEAVRAGIAGDHHLHLASERRPMRVQDRESDKGILLWTRSVSLGKIGATEFSVGTGAAAGPEAPHWSTPTL